MSTHYLGELKRFHDLHILLWFHIVYALPTGIETWSLLYHIHCIWSCLRITYGNWNIQQLTLPDESFDTSTHYLRELKLFSSLFDTINSDLVYALPTGIETLGRLCKSENSTVMSTHYLRELKQDETSHIHNLLLPVYALPTGIETLKPGTNWSLPLSSLRITYGNWNVLILGTLNDVAFAGKILPVWDWNFPYSMHYMVLLPVRPPYLYGIETQS